MSRDSQVAGGDQDARQDMFASRVASYNSEPLLGTGASTAHASFNREHPLYRAIARLASLRRRPRRTARRSAAGACRCERAGAVCRVTPRPAQRPRAADRVQHLDHCRQRTGDHRRQLRQFLLPRGSCEPSASVPGSYHVEVPPLDYIVCAAGVGP